MRSRFFCSVLLLLSLLIHVAKPTLKIKLNLFAQLFYWAVRQGSLMLFYGNSDFQSNKQISKEPEKSYWTHATHSVWAQDTVLDYGKFSFQTHPQTKLKFQKCFLCQTCSKFSLEGPNARWRTNGTKIDLVPKWENKRVQTNVQLGSSLWFCNWSKESI